MLRGPGVSKSSSARVFAHQACRAGIGALSAFTGISPELMTTCRKGHYRKMLAYLARTDLVVLDDLRLAVMGNASHRNLAKILEDCDER
ncbi:MAG: ATP-binding protein [Burkholderiales bacterium]